MIHYKPGRRYFLNFIRKTPEKTLYFGFRFTGIRSKAIGIRTEITALISNTTENRIHRMSFWGILDFIPCILLGIYMA